MGTARGNIVGPGGEHSMNLEGLRKVWMIARALPGPAPIRLVLVNLLLACS